MKATECILARRSCRKFLEKPITEETIRTIVELASYAPSWKNQQIVRYTVVRGVLKEKISAECTVSEFNVKTMYRADALAVISYKDTAANKEGGHTDGEWAMFDAGLAVQTFCLAAREQEVGTCILGVCDMDKIHAMLQLPEDERVACVVAMGYPVEWKNAPVRLSVEELLTIRQ